MAKFSIAPAQDRGAHKRNARLLFGGEIQRAPGLPIDQIIVTRTSQAYTQNGVSLYARWLLVRANFGEFAFHALG
jgi:hypothetical protein